jgi:putative ABC transport system permease protein
MLFAALRDMHWRRRRLVIAIISTELVFAMTLVLTGLARGGGRSRARVRRPVNRG